MLHCCAQCHSLSTLCHCIQTSTWTHTCFFLPQYYVTLLYWTLSFAPFPRFTLGWTRVQAVSCAASVYYHNMDSSTTTCYAFMLYAVLCLIPTLWTHTIFHS